jgi:hypothetical protein
MRINKTRYLKIKRLLLASIVVMPFNVLAVEPISIILNSGITITPMIITGLKYDDNITHQKVGVGSSIFTLAPSVNFSLSDGLSSYQFDAKVKSENYFSSSQDNYLNKMLAFNSHIEPSYLSRFDIKAAANWLTEARGTGITQGDANIPSVPVRYNEQVLNVAYEYGALSSSARVALNTQYRTKDYQNLLTVNYGGDYDSLLIGTTFYYSTSPSSNTFIELTSDTINYNNLAASLTSLDANDSKALLGITWHASAFTSSSIKLGFQHKSFESSTRQNFSGLSWAANLQWQPMSYSTFSFKTSRQGTDPNGTGDDARASQYSIKWKHNWNQRINTQFALSLADNKYYSTIRKDDTTSINTSIDYALLRWVDVSFYIELTNKNSTRKDLVFDKKVMGININFSM